MLIDLLGVIFFCFFFFFFFSFFFLLCYFILLYFAWSGCWVFLFVFFSSRSVITCAYASSKNKMLSLFSYFFLFLCAHYSCFVFFVFYYSYCFRGFFSLLFSLFCYFKRYVHAGGHRVDWGPMEDYAEGVCALWLCDWQVENTRFAHKRIDHTHICTYTLWLCYWHIGSPHTPSRFEKWVLTGGPIARYQTHVQALLYCIHALLYCIHALLYCIHALLYYACTRATHNWLCSILTYICTPLVGSRSGYLLRGPSRDIKHRWNSPRLSPWTVAAHGARVPITW